MSSHQQHPQHHKRLSQPARGCALPSVSLPRGVPGRKFLVQLLLVQLQLWGFRHSSATSTAQHETRLHMEPAQVALLSSLPPYHITQCHHSKHKVPLLNSPDLMGS